MAEETAGNAGRGPTAPYTAFQTLKTLIKPFKDHGPPSRIDRSVLTSFSGAVGSQVLTMLKFMQLIDDNGRPTEKLRALIEAYDTDRWPIALGNIVREAYAPLFKINLETSSPNEFNEQFRKTYPAADEVSRKSMTFFLNAAREAGLKISPYIMKGKKPRTVPTKKRVPKPQGDKTIQVDFAAARAPVMAVSEKSLSQQLLEALDLSNMEQAETDAAWAVIKYLKRAGK